MPRKLAQTLALSAVAAAALLGGCRSDDQHEFAMPLDRTGTVTIVDALSEEKLWSKELPPGHKLVLDFERDGVIHDDELFLTKSTPANEVHWSLYGPNKSLVVDQQPWGGSMGYGVVDLPGTPVRMEVTYDRVKRAAADRAPVIAEPAAAPAVAPAAEPEAEPVVDEAVPVTPAEPESAPVVEETPAPAAPEAEPAPEATPEPADDPAFK